MKLSVFEKQLITIGRLQELERMNRKVPRDLRRIDKGVNKLVEKCK